MKKIETGDPETMSADVVAQNLEVLKEAFPEAFTEGKVDFEVLKQLLGGAVDEREEKYGLNWHGKRRARQLALTPSTGTLRPCPEESVDWETTKNLMIEGDNLEVLKLLQKSYAGKVKMIYIDPPYNTGKDFVYPDNFQDNIQNYLELTGQVDCAGRKLSSNTEASGRFHTDWLNMMYPRLKLARSLLRPDGLLLVSIDDGEAVRLVALCDEVFGEENFIAQLVWKSRVSEDTRAKTGVSTDHEYILCYSRSEGTSLRGAEKDLDKFGNPDEDPRGPWRSADLTGLATREARPNLHYDLIDPSTGINYGCPPKGWRFEPPTMERKVREGRILFPSDGVGRPRHKLFLRDMKSLFKNMCSVVTGPSTADGTREVNGILGTGVFQFPKPASLIRLLVEQCSSSDDIIMDFFAGSGTCGHSVLLQNAADGGTRRFVLVQLPEPLEVGDGAQDSAARLCQGLGTIGTVAELTKERLRRVGLRVKKENRMFVGDVGFRVFKLDTSNIRAWDPAERDLEKTLTESMEHVKTGRSDGDVLFELLLKLGLDLAVPMETRTIGGKTVHSIGAGTLMVCLDKKIAREEVDALALGIVQWLKELSPAGETQVVFRDSAFANDVVKTNLTAILQQHGLENVRSL
jgi:adenine-specific DNA-methyltransferase